MATVDVTQENFEAEVLQADKPVLVDFWAPWCGPCQMLGPIIDELAEEVDGKAVVAKINIDDQPELASKYKVMSIPTLIVFKDGEPSAEVVGVKQKDEILEIMDI